MHTLYCWVLRKEVSSTIFKVWHDATWDWTQVSQTIGEPNTINIQFQIGLENAFFSKLKSKQQENLEIFFEKQFNTIKI